MYMYMYTYMYIYIYILVAGISSLAAGLNDRPIYVRFVIEKVTMGQFSAKYSDITLLRIINDQY